MVERRLRTLAAAGRALCEPEDLDTLYDLIAVSIRDVLTADVGVLVRIDPVQGLARVLRIDGWSRGEEPEAARQIDRIHALDAFPHVDLDGDDIAPTVFTVTDAQRTPAVHDRLTSGGLHSLLTVPVVSGSELWGHLIAGRRDPAAEFDGPDRVAGQALAGLVSGAVARLRDRASMRRLAYLDPLTGLANRRAVDDLLEERFAADDLERPIAAVLCDVDGLKGVNDSRGHEAGDRLLREVADLLTIHAAEHPKALAARLGGDEFCLLLDGATDEEAEAVTRELSAAGSELRDGDGLSCGWASLTRRPPEAPTPMAAARALLRLADAAQYRSKRDARARRRGEPPAPVRGGPGGADPGAGTRLAAEGIAAVGGKWGARERVLAVARVAVDELHAPGWAVSRVDAAGRVHPVAGGDATTVHRAEPPTPSAADSSAPEPRWSVAPTVRRLAGGGSAHVQLDRGEEAERAALAALGFTDLIAVGAVDAAGDTWVLELTGDALSSELGAHEGAVRLLVELAVREAVGAGEVREAGGLSGPNASR